MMDPNKLNFDALPILLRTSLSKFKDKSINEFFTDICKLIGIEIGAKEISLWAYSDCNGVLVHMGGYPNRSPDLASKTILAENSFTGFSVKNAEIISINVEDLHKLNVSFNNNKILEYYSITKVISIPIRHIYKKNIISHACNIYLSESSNENVIVSDKLLSNIQVYLEFIYYFVANQLSRKARSSVARIAPYAKGASSLFLSISNDLGILTRANCYAAYVVDIDNNKLVNILSINRDDLPKEIKFKNNDKIDIVHDAIGCIRKCLHDNQPFIHKEIIGIGSNQSIACKHMVAPIITLNGGLLAILYCGFEDDFNNDEYPFAFSSLDLYILRRYGLYLEPHFERFLIYNKESKIYKVISEVSAAMAEQFELDNILKTSIDSVCKLMNSPIGSIYLMDSDGELVMRAAHGPNEHLVGKAKYTINNKNDRVGLTGAIALNGNIINLKSRKEVISHPQYLGKYDKDIDFSKALDQYDAFLGVPIKISNRVIGVWKITGIYGENGENEQFFTEEDERAAEILSSIFAYAIENKRQEDRIIYRSRLLAKTVSIESSQNESDAIAAVFAALEESSIDGATLYLFNSGNNKIENIISFGIADEISLYPKELNINSDSELAIIIKNKDVPKETIKLKHKSESIVEIKLPLRTDDELIGLLILYIVNGNYYGEDTKLIAEAFAGHLSVAISRIRYIQKSLDITDEVMRSSRFIVAESMSGVALHSLRHQLENIVKQLEKDLGTKEIKENKMLLKTLSAWNDKLSPLFVDISALMNFVKKATNESINVTSKAHDEIQKSVEMWLHLLREHKSNISKKYNAENDLVEMYPYSLREILSIFIINSIQAYAKIIEIKTYCENDYTIYDENGQENYIVNAFIVDVEDDGCGIVAEDTNDIFTSTYSTKPDKFGTGLGLFIARRLSKKAGGWVEYVGTNKKGKGSIFRLIVPCAGDLE